MKRMTVLLLALCTVAITANTTQARRARKNKAVDYRVAIAAGMGGPTSPTEFTAGWDPSFGMMGELGAAMSMLEASVSVDYNFFLSNTEQPIDINTLQVFANIKIKPNVTERIHPYIVAGGGYFRYWIVDQNVYENTLGYSGGGGIEFDIGKTQRLFVEGKDVFGRTRETNIDKANTEFVTVRLGLSIMF